MASKVVVFLLILGFTSFCFAAQNKIKLGPENVIDGWAAYPQAGNLGPAQNLLDEQVIAGDPANGSGGKPKTEYFPGWTKWYYPNAFALIDLGQMYRLSSIWAFHGYGSYNIEFSVGVHPFQWAETFNDSVHGTYQWDSNNITTSAPVQWIKVRLIEPPKLLEIVVYGEPVGNPTPPPPPKPRQLPLFKDFIGTNGFNDDDPNKLAAVGVVREYQTWGWSEGNGQPGYVGYPHSKNEFDPDGYAGPPFRFDTFYRACKNVSVKVHQCMMRTAPYIHKNTPNEEDWKPLTVEQMNTPGVSTNPLSYAPHGDHAWQLAARYGRTRVDVGLLKLGDNQNKTTGADLLEYIEFWNEQDKWWLGREAYFSPYEYAAMLSADYDGHAGIMGNTIGVKNADPTMKVVMGGIAQLNLDWVKSLRIWSLYNRKDGKFPAEAINFHHYSNDVGGQGGTATTGISPEDDHLKERVQAIVQWRNIYLPGVEVWFSEFGYDTNQASPQKSPAIGPNSGEIVQGQWIIRSFLALAAAGVDRAHQFMLRNVADYSGGKFQTSGLTTTKASGWKPKPSWYFVSTITKRLGNMRFISDKHDTVKNVTSVKLSDGNGNTAYVVWSPTSKALVVEKYSFSFDTSVTKATLVELVDQEPNGKETPLIVNGKSVQLDVTETPLIVLTQ